MEQKVSGHKDIIFLLSVVRLTLFLEKLNFKNQKYLIILFIFIVTFSHSGFLVYIPIFYIIFIIVNHKIELKNVLQELAIISIFCLILFCVIVFNTSIDKDQF